MAKTLEEAYRQIIEASVLPNPANLKKPGIGPESGQVDLAKTGGPKMNMAKADSDALRNKMTTTQSYSDMAKTKTPADYAKAGLVSNTGRAPANISDQGARKSISGTNDVQTRLANARKNAPAFDPSRNKALDNASTTPMALAQNRQALADKAQANRAGTNTFDANKKIGSKIGTSVQGPNKPTGNPNVRTSGTPAIAGNADIKPSAKLNFKQAYAAARKSGQTNFEWGGKKFNTNMKGETSATRTKVLARNVNRTAGRNARVGASITEGITKMKNLAEMIKDLRKKKLMELEQLPGGMGKFKGGADIQDMSGPNKPVNASEKEQHHVKEARSPMVSGGAQGKATLGKLESRVGGQIARGNQNIRGRNLAETEKEIGKTATGQKTKKGTETIDTKPEKSDETYF